MPTLLLADIHGNLPALEAVLATPEARRCGDIVSLGDHVNFGPESRAVHARLTGLGAVMLLGNHEERLTRPDDAAFDGYNWALMRWTAHQMQGIDLNLPKDMLRGSVLFTHGTPGDPYHLVYPEDLPGVLAKLPEDVTLLLSGHNHHRWDVSCGGRRAFNPGSLGLCEDGIGGVAPFAVLEDGQVTQHQVAYDVGETLRRMVALGAHRVAPEMCRMVAHVMRTAEYQGVLKLVRHVSTVAAGMGLTLGDRAAWETADRTYPWAEPLTSPEYWRHMEEIC